MRITTLAINLLLDRREVGGASMANRQARRQEHAARAAAEAILPRCRTDANREWKRKV
jgi:hypothetical protein